MRIWIFLMEQLGIYCYTSPLPRNKFLGIYKFKPEDFVVTELSSNGELATLDDNYSSQLKPTVDTAIPELPCDSRDELQLSVTHNKEQYQDTLPPVKNLIPEHLYEALAAMASLDKQRPEVPTSVNLGAGRDKVERKLIHRAVRNSFPQLKTNTVSNDSGVQEIHVMLDSNYSRLQALIGHDDTCRLLKFLYVENEESCLISANSSKEHRTQKPFVNSSNWREMSAKESSQVHHTLGEMYGHMIVTHTRTLLPAVKKAKGVQPQCDKKNFIVVKFRRRKVRTRQETASSQEVFTQFVLRKENMETLEAVNVLSRALGCHNSQLAYAGLKDTRAVTTQFMTIRGVSPSQLAALGPLPHMTIGNFQPAYRHIHLGEHTGNHFKLLVRDFCLLIPLKPSLSLKESIGECVKLLEKNGFVNYFGPQRFGYSHQYPQRVLSHQIGLAMLQGSYMKAVDLILTPDDGCDAVQIAKKHFTTTKDAVATLKMMPKHMTREQLVLKALNCHGYSDYGCTRALCSLPYKSRLLYIHSYSSLLWNHLVSFRIKEYGYQPVVGDLVLKQDQASSSTLRDAVHVLTSLDVSSGGYSMGDVVLPTVGITTILPGHKVADRLNTLLTEDGLSLKSFRLRKLNLSSSGAYRHIMQYPTNVRWKLLKVVEGADSVSSFDGGVKLSTAEQREASTEQSGKLAKETVEGELTKITSSKECVPVADEGCGSGENRTGKSVETVECDQDMKHNLELEFSLPPSSYATVLLRELLKM